MAAGSVCDGLWTKRYDLNTEIGFKKPFKQTMIILQQLFILLYRFTVRKIRELAVARARIPTTQVSCDATAFTKVMMMPDKAKVVP